MSEDRRSAILDAALRILEREGPRGFKQTRVAAEAKVEQGHLTYYFPKKVDLVLGVFERFATRSREELTRAFAGATKESSPSLLFEFAKTLAKDHRRTRLLLGLIVETQPEPELAQKLGDLVRTQRRVFAALLGRPEGDLDAELALAALRGIGVENMLLSGQEKRVDELVARLAEWLEAGKQTRPPA